MLSQTNPCERPAVIPSRNGPLPERPIRTNSPPGDHPPASGSNAINQGATIEPPKKKKKKANIRINALNLNGATAPSENMTFHAKWNRISQTIQTEKIAILAVQETHLDQDMIDQLQARYEKNLTIIASPHPTTPHAKAGVAFIINKRLICLDTIKTHEIIPGKALYMELKWLKSCTVTILNVYAPNDRSAHANFWAKIITERRLRHIPIPDFTLGNFNVTEDAIDRMPPRPDNKAAITTLRDVRHEWDIQDMWRHTNPTEHAFMYRAQTQAGQIQARLDRIYIAKSIEQYTFDWKIQETAIPTDHAMVSARYAPKAAPFIGQGRWTLPTHLLNEENLISKIADSGVKFLSEATRIRVERIGREDTNIQILSEDYKKAIKGHAKDTAKEHYHKVTSRI